MFDIFTMEKVDVMEDGGEYILVGYDDDIEIFDLFYEDGFLNVEKMDLEDLLPEFQEIIKKSL